VLDDRVVEGATDLVKLRKVLVQVLEDFRHEGGSESAYAVEAGQ